MNCGNEMEIEHICSIVGLYVPTIEHINPHIYRLKNPKNQNTF